MSKMTDKDVIKALECCIKLNAEPRNWEICKKDCPYKFNCCDKEKGIYFEKDALDLINRLKGDAIHYRRKAQNQKQELSRLNAEIERLKEELEIRNQKRASIFEISNAYERGRAEAIKEFEVKIHEKLHQAEMHGNFEPVVTREMFDSVVKEMVGEQK